MKLSNLSITRNASYESNPNGLKGMVQLEGPTGKQEISLTPMVILRIFKVIEDEVCIIAKHNAKQTPGAFKEVEGELTLIEHPLNTPLIEE